MDSTEFVEVSSDTAKFYLHLKQLTQDAIFFNYAKIIKQIKYYISIALTHWVPVITFLV